MKRKRTPEESDKNLQEWWVAWRKTFAEDPPVGCLYIVFLAAGILFFLILLRVAEVLDTAF